MTQYQIYYFGMGFRERISEAFFWFYMIITTVNFGLMIYCIGNFVKYWVKPDLLCNQEGLLKAMNAAISYDSISLLFLFLIFFVAVNLKIDEMMPFFYHGLPPFIFEIAF